MKLEQVERHYRKFYESIEFERIGLFECLKHEFGERKVIYLGSSAHITPSFVFSNVTYVDSSDIAKDFFSDENAITKFVDRRKSYKRTPKLKFLGVDYTKCEIQNQYDLVLAIFSPDSFSVAQQIVEGNSLLVYLALPSERHTLKEIGNLKVVGTIQMKKGKYRYSQNVLKNNYSKKDMIENKFQDVYVYSILARR